MKISGIYKIQSKVKPERIYIGSAVNISKGLKGLTTGRKNTEETKKKMSESAMGNKNNVGHKLTDTHKRAVSEGMKRVWKERRTA